MRKRNQRIGLFMLTVIYLFIPLFVSCTGKSAASASFSNVKWTLIGPYDEPESGSCALFYSDLLTAYGSEAALSNAELPKGLKSNAKIQAKDHLVNFGARFPGKNDAVAYAALSFKSEGGERFFRMGSDDGLRVWLNGELMVDEHAHRSSNPDSNSFRAVLKKGTNHILVKVCQGTGDWGFTIRQTSREEHEAFLAERSQITLSVATKTRFLEDNEFSFSIFANPAPLVEVPLTYTISDPQNKVITSGTAREGEAVTAKLPENCEGSLRLTAVPEEVQDTLTRQKLENVKLETVFFMGRKDAVLPSYSAQARSAADELINSNAWKSLTTADLKAIEDIAPTLLYLADMIDGNLDSSLVNDSKQIMAVLFASDILSAMKEGPQALSAMTGYRQMAYISDIDDSIQPYSLYLPESFSPDKTYSLIVVAHGYSGDDYGGGGHVPALLPQDFIIVSVFARGDVHYQSVGEQDVLDVMDRVMARYPVDKSRVYLMGSSMGGLGTWRIGTLYADRFAAIAPYCGWTGTVFMENLKNTKTFVVHGAADTTVPVQFDRACVNKLQELGYDVTYVEIPNGGHSAWTEWSKLYPPQSILDFFRQAQRGPSPEKLAATVNQVRYGKHDWITVNELDTSGPLVKPHITVSTQYDSTYPLLPKPGRFNAKRSENGSIVISTERINALSVDLKTAAPSNKPAEEITIDGALIRVPAGAQMLHLARNSSGQWELDARFETEQLPRHEGGGLADLFTKPVIFVYGTQNAQRADLLEAAARELSDWSYRPGANIGVKCGSFQVRADTELTEEERTMHHLILFGTPQENSISALYQEELKPFYQDGEVFIAGKKYTGNGLCLTIPNPQVQGKILGYIDPPKGLDTVGAVKQYFLNIQYRFRNSYINELNGSPTFFPDVFVMTPHPFEDAWSGWFDRYWENLRGTE